MFGGSESCRGEGRAFGGLQMGRDTAGLLRKTRTEEKQEKGEKGKKRGSRGRLEKKGRPVEEEEETRQKELPWAR